VRARPEHRVSCDGPEAIRLGEPRGDAIVVAGDADRRDGAEPLHAGVGVRVVTDEIARADEAIGAFGRRGVEHPGERLEVPVDVGEDGVSQGRPPMVRARAPSERATLVTKGEASSQAKTS